MFADDRISRAIEAPRFSYGIDMTIPGFWGGRQPFSNWLTRDGLFGALEHFGWREINVLEDTDYLYGPAVSLTARHCSAQ